MERLSFASLTLSAMTSHKRLKLRQCTNCECVINGVWEWVEECARAAAEEEPAMRGILAVPQFPGYFHLGAAGPQALPP